MRVPKLLHITALAAGLIAAVPWHGYPAYGYGYGYPAYGYGYGYPAYGYGYSYAPSVSYGYDYGHPYRRYGYAYHRAHRPVYAAYRVRHHY